jgi:hypothetical protein
VTAHEAEIAHWTSVKCKRAKIHKAQAASALNFLVYLNDYLKEKVLWLQWSKAGTIVAAEHRGVSVSSIAWTNNHLESHNRHIKGKYFKPFTHGGRLLRLDYWVQMLILLVIPEFYTRLANKHKLSDYQTAMCCALPTESSLAELDSEIEILLAQVHSDTADAQSSDSESKEFDIMSDSKSSSTSGLEELLLDEVAMHEAEAFCKSNSICSEDSVMHVSESIKLEDLFDAVLQLDNALDDSDILSHLCQAKEPVPSPLLVNKHALIAQEVISLKDEFVALLKKAAAMNMDLIEIKNWFVANVNRQVGEIKQHTLDTSGSLHDHVTILPPVEIINTEPIDSAEMNWCFGSVIEDLGLDSDEEQLLPFVQQKKEKQKNAYGIR